MKTVASLFESNVLIKDYREIGVTFDVPKAVVPPGTRNMVQAIDDVAVVNRDYDFTVRYEDLPEFYNSFTAVNNSSSPVNNARYRGGFKSDDDQFRLAVEIPLLEEVLFVEMSANSIWVVTQQVVGNDIVERARWSNDPYLTNFFFTTNSSGKVIISNTYPKPNGSSTPLSKFGRPVRNNDTGKWYLPVEYSWTIPLPNGKIYELDETNGNVATLQPNKRHGGYQIRLPGIINTANRSSAYTLQSGRMFPNFWRRETYIDNPAMFFWKGRLMMLDDAGGLNYSTTDFATFQTQPAPPTGSMFYIVDEYDRESRIIAAGLDSATSHRNIVLWELRSIGGAWTKIGTCVDAGLSPGYSGRITANTGAFRDIVPTDPTPIPHTDTIVSAGFSSLQYWYPSGTISISQDEDGGTVRLNIGFAYWHAGLYNGGPTASEDALLVNTSDSYQTMLQATLLQTTDPGFSTDVNNTFYLGLRQQMKGWAVVPDNTLDLNTSYMNLFGNYGMIFGGKHFAFSNKFTHWDAAGSFPNLNNSVQVDPIDAFKYIPSYKDIFDFPSNLFPLYDSKLLGRRNIFALSAMGTFFVKGEYNRVDYYNTIDRNDVTGKPRFRAFSEMLDPKDIYPPNSSSGFGSISGISATGSGIGISSYSTIGGVFSGPNAKTIGIQTPGGFHAGIPAVSSMVWLLGSNLNRREPFTLNKLLHPVDWNSKTLYTIVGA